MTRGSILAWCVLAATPVCFGRADDSAAVLDLFTRYKAALLAGDGATASSLVDRETFSYFEEIKKLTLSGSEDEVRKRPFVDRLLIVTMRHELPAAELEAMELQDLLEHAIDAGWIGKQSIAQLGIGAVTVEGESASAIAITPGQTPADAALAEGLRYRFVRENGEWRFGFRSLVDSINQMIAQLTTQMGTDQDQLIFVLVEQLSGRKVLPDVWTSTGSASAPTPLSTPPVLSGTPTSLPATPSSTPAAPALTPVSPPVAP